MCPFYLSMIKRTLLFLSILTALIACKDDDSFTTSPSARLSFSTDTVRMDTVFTTIGSSTYTLWVYNNADDGLRIARTYLKNGNQTGFRVNVDGSYLDNSLGSSVSDLEVRKGDSIRVFVELTAPKNMQTIAQKITDDLVFLLESGVEQRVCLRSYAWDAWIMRSPVFAADTTIQTEKPILVYGKMQVKEGVTLTLRKTRLFFHDQSGIEVFGTLITDSVLMRGDRLDHMFDYLPYDRISGQWEGLTFRSSSTGNKMTDTELHSGTYGICCDSAALSPDNIRLYMERCVIHNSKGHGVQLTNSYASMVNCQVTNSLGDCVTIDGGAVNIRNCTLGQFYPFSAERGVALRFVNGTDSVAHPLEQMDCRNSIVTGYADDELMGTQKKEDAAFNYYFENCLLRTPEIADTTHFKEIIWEKPSDEIQGKKHFVTFDETNFIYDFHLDSLSTAKGKGCY